MADLKISQLTAKGTAIAATDLVEISESDGAGGYVTKSVTGTNILSSKQDTLVSGTNIKTINSNSILGSGNLVITGGVSSVSATTPVVATGTTTPVISLASSYGDTQNPYGSKTANNILAAPNGTAGVPTFRAIVSADIPTLNQNTTGTAANVTGIVALANGGTGTATPSLVAGTNINITGTFPNQTITATGTAGAVTQIVAGTNVTLSPAGGTGIVTINASGGGGGTQIGDLIGGGVVVAVFNDSGVNKALIASLTNLSAGLPYTITAFQSTLIGATAQSFSNGLTNTNAIIAQTLLPAADTYAAGRARNYLGGTFTDWYLPSLWELNMCYNSAALTSRIAGVTSFISNGFYASSTEGGSSFQLAQDFFNGSRANYGKNNNFNVRAVRIHTI